ncbi:hypothetical protein OFO94_31505, partial [Escherichia coli]|nr:hypothetical protein [Escherichia coli]
LGVGCYLTIDNAHSLALLSYNTSELYEVRFYQAVKIRRVFLGRFQFSKNSRPIFTINTNPSFLFSQHQSLRIFFTLNDFSYITDIQQS